jgi:aryl-alcohol dehydrogenase-like predicted oxidoreductase
MRYVEVGGARVSVIGLGTWQFGSREWGYGDAFAEVTAPAIVRRALELGVTLIDSAEAYGLGRSERIVGRALDGQRDHAFLATKIMPVLPLPRVVQWRARASAERLGVPTIDLYQLHWPNPLVPPRTTMRGIRQLLDAGLVRHAGVSNYSLKGWRIAERSLGRPVLSNQVRFSLASPGPRWDLVPYAGERDRLVIAYSPLAQGLLAGHLAERGDERRPGVRRMNPLYRPRALRLAGPLLDTVADVAAAHGATAAQISLAWLISHENVVAIPGASSLVQLEENVAAADIVLSAAEQQRLARAADRFEAALRG